MIKQFKLLIGLRATILRSHLSRLRHTSILASCHKAINATENFNMSKTLGIIWSLFEWLKKWVYVQKRKEIVWWVKSCRFFLNAYDPQYVSVGVLNLPAIISSLVKEIRKHGSTYCFSTAMGIFINSQITYSEYYMRVCHFIMTVVEMFLYIPSSQCV